MSCGDVQNVYNVMKKGDVIIIASLLIVAAALFALSLAGGGDYACFAEIAHDGEVIARLPLTEDAEFTFDDGEHLNIVEVSGGGVYMQNANCPDGYCMHQGTAERVGDCIVCLPNRITVTVKGGGQGEVDAVTQ